MAEPISIGGQTFVKTSDGWIDKKSKIPADKGLLKLLNSLESDGPSPKLRVKIDRNREPVNFAGTKYVYDLNQKGWIDQKTKIKVHDKLQNILNGVSKPMASPTTLGLIGQAGISKTKDRKPDGSGVIPIRKKINEPIVSMISSLSSIDSYLKQQLDNQKKIAKGQIAALRESAIESTDATPVTQLKDSKEKNSSNSAVLLMGAGIAAIIASQFEPVQEAFKVVADGVKNVFGYITRFAGIMADGLGLLLGGDAAPSNSSPATLNATPVSAPSPTPNSVSQPQEQQVNQAEESVPAQPSEASEPNLTVTGEVEQTPSAPSNVSTPSSPSRTASTLTGAATGAAIGMMAGPVGATAGAVIGGAIGFFSGGSQYSDPGQERVNAPQATGPMGDFASNFKDPVPGGSWSGPGLGLPRDGGRRRHQGIDIFAPMGTPVYASADGEVVYSERRPRGGFGIAVQLKHPGGYITKYAHLSGLAGLSPGQRVNAGQLVGYVGDTGNAKGTPPHLHYEIWRNGSMQEPANYLSGGGGQGGYETATGLNSAGYGGILGGAVKSISDLGAGAIKAIGNIMAAGLGPGTNRSLMDSLNQSPENSASAIARAAVERNATIAEERSADSPTPVVPSPVNINKNPQSAAIENIPMPGDRAGVDHYLTRFGFPKIEYNQRSPELRWA